MSDTITRKRIKQMQGENTMSEVRDDVRKMWLWFQDNHDSEEFTLLLFNVQSSLVAINKHINDTIRQDIKNSQH